MATSKTYYVQLSDGTTGTIHSDTIDGKSAEDFIGEIVNVHSYDENGCEFEKEGELIAVLDEKNDWE